jgi:two-component system, cell cycle response regulator
MNEFMNEKRTKVLLAGDSPDDALFWERMLSSEEEVDLEFVPIDEFAERDHHGGKIPPDLLLLDLSGPGRDPLPVFWMVHNAVPTVPILVITGSEDPPLAIRVISEGAQDCLVKGQLNAHALARITHFSLARQRSLQQLRSFSLIDELTGLYNRRGFLALAEQQLKLANRTGQSLLLAFVDVDGLKTINDLFGHQRGDLAIIETAHVLREAFRETDILARLGGDEFVALLVCGGDTQAETLARKFRATMEEHNTYGKSGFKLSASIGLALSDPGMASSISELMERADKLMYAQKKSRRMLPVAYQLRFLNSAPIGAWLNSTAALLEPLVPPGAWPLPMPPPGGKVVKIRTALARGLLTFVTRRSLCGTETVCDLGCSPALENKSPDRLEACVIMGPVRQYLVEGALNLQEMSEKLAGAVLREWPKAGPVSGKIRDLLRDALSSHLYENTQCRRAPLCERSEPMNLKWELQHSKPYHSLPGTQPGERDARRLRDESQNLEGFFKKHRLEWKKRIVEKLQTAFREYKRGPGRIFHPK